MFTALRAIYDLQWKPNRKYHPLPAHIVRTFTATPNGELELLISHPKYPKACSPPIIFAHGGFGHASVWLEWMTFFHNHYGGSTYAYSARNHGASYSVPYFKMVWGTSLDDVASDWASVIHDVRHRFEGGNEPILVGHSAGGALTQYVLLNRMATTRGLCLVGSIPHFGSYDANWNWVKADPWLFLRTLLSGGHPASPLSHPSLVHTAFFGPRFPRSKDDGWASIKEFMKWMPGYESAAWASAMTGSFWKWITGRNEWLEVPKILMSISNWEGSEDKVCMIVGSDDRLMDLKMAERQFQEYADGVRLHQDEKKLDLNQKSRNDTLISGISMRKANRIQLAVVDGAGHHTQNDIQWGIAAEVCRSWAEQL